MKKIKKFNLNQNHYLSLREMEQVNGGGYLYDHCTENTVGAPCLYTEGGSHFTGTCHGYTNSSSSSSGNGTSYSYSAYYYCQKD